MTLDQVKKLGNSVGIAVGVNRNGVINLLSDNGIYFETPPTDEFLINTTIDTLSENENFREDFNTMLQSIADIFPKKGNGFANADGSFDLGSALGGAFGLIGNIVGSNAQRKLAKEQGKQALQQSASEIELAKLALEAEKQKLAQIQAANKSPKNNALLYVGIGIGALVFVTVIVIAVKASKK